MLNVMGFYQFYQFYKYLHLASCHRAVRIQLLGLDGTQAVGNRHQQQRLFVV